MKNYRENFRKMPFCFLKISFFARDMVKNKNDNLSGFEMFSIIYRKLRIKLQNIRNFQRFVKFYTGICSWARENSKFYWIWRFGEGVDNSDDREQILSFHQFFPAFPWKTDYKWIYAGSVVMFRALEQQRNFPPYRRLSNFFISSQQSCNWQMHSQKEKRFFPRILGKRY